MFTKEVSSLNYSKDLEKNKIIPGMLYLVGTPIGNLSDLSDRAKKVLAEVDFVACEDTRVTGKLLATLNISKPLVSYFEHNKGEKGEYIISRLKNNESCALVTDAGMPAISDPGEDLVVLCSQESIPVTTIPGPCAAISALALSALDTRRFTFEGFLPVSGSERKNRLNEISQERKTVILYEAPHKLKKTLCDLKDKLGNRKITLCREMTKLNEEILRTDLEGAVAHYETNAPRGEYVLILEGTTEEKKVADSWWKDLSIEEHVARYIDEDYMTKNDAIRRCAHDRGLSRNYVYKLMIGD